MVCKYILFACCLCQRWAAMVSYIQNPVFHYMEDKHFLPLLPDSMTQYVHHLCEHRPNEPWRHQERIKCNTTAMPTLWDAEGKTDSTCSFNKQLFIWAKQGKIMETPHTCPKILPSRFSSLTLSFHRQGESIHEVDWAAEDPLNPNQPWLFQVSMFTWGAALTPILPASQEALAAI